VSDPQGVASLRFRLNGGSWKNLTVGADGRRLLSPGDFNAEIDHDVLVAGNNTVELQATDSLGNVATTLVTVQWTDGVTPAPSFATNWAGASSVTDQAQPVDGHWQLVPGGVRSSDVGYDRLLALGDLGWVDYDLTTTVTVHQIDAAGAAANPNSGSPALWFIPGWQGHSPLNANDPSQPYWYYWPSGAFLGYGYTSGGAPRVIAIGNENVYEGGPNFRQYANSAMANPNAANLCGFFPTFFGCRPATVETNLGIDEGFVHPFADRIEELALDYTLKMTEQAREKGVTLINAYELFAGHHSRFDDPTSPAYVRGDPTYWAYMAEINALGNEVVADVMLHILNTGRKVYQRKHSDEFIDRALESEFDGVYGY